MSQPIQLGSVLGGRYKVTAQVVTTADQDQVLDGKDQLLERRVSILAASPRHSELLISNARELAAGSEGGSIQILDLGQSGDITYLITSHTRPQHLLDLLLTDRSGIEAESEKNHALGAEIFGASTTEPHDDYEQVNPDEPAPQQASREKPKAPKEPAVVPWTQADYDAYGEDEPVSRSPGAAASGRNLFERAATDITGSSPNHASPMEDDSTEYYGSFADPEEVEGEQTSPFVEGVDYDEYEDEDDDAGSTAATRTGSTERVRQDRHRSTGRFGLWITFLVVLLLVLALIFFGFSHLHGMVTSFGSTSQGQESSASPGAGDSSTQAGPAPKITEINRLVPDNPDFMADQDATLGQAVDGDPSTEWTSYGFSSPDFGQAVSGFGLSLKLEQPAKTQQLAIQQSGATGGQFTVYVNDSASLDGATEAGTGSLQEGTTTVPFSDDAKNKDAQYVIVYFTEAPQLTEPIGGYPYGIRIGELSLK